MYTDLIDDTIVLFNDILNQKKNIVLQNKNFMNFYFYL